MAAFEAGELTLCPVYTEDFSWSNTNPVEPLRADSEILNPLSCSIEGRRFAVESAVDEGMSRRRMAETSVPGSEQKSKVSSQNKGRAAAKSPRTHYFESRKTKRNLSETSTEGDGSGHMVSWLDWTFHVSVDGRRGLVMRNLTFKGQRVAYEISVQEYFASYSSIGSTAQVFYYDRCVN